MTAKEPRDFDPSQSGPPQFTHSERHPLVFLVGLFFAMVALYVVINLGAKAMDAVGVTDALKVDDGPAANTPYNNGR